MKALKKVQRSDCSLTGLDLSKKKTSRGFTLIELMAATTILLLLIAILLALLNQTTRALGASGAQVQAFRSAQNALETLKRTLSQATLNTYWGYDPPPPLSPVNYVRLSEMHYVSGSARELTGLASTITHATFFQSPLGFSSPSAAIDATSLYAALNTTGFFVEFGSDASLRPAILDPNSAPRYRYRLFQYLESTTDLSVYKTNSGLAWFKAGVNPPSNTASSGSKHVVAENVLAMILIPKTASSSSADLFNLTRAITESWGANGYNYDSREGSYSIATRNYLPPLIRVIIVAIDEESAIRLQGTSTSMPIDLDSLQLFRDTTTEQKLRQDLETLEEILQGKSGNPANNDLPLNYRIFETEINLPNSK